MPIRSKFLSDRAISNEEFERQQQISESLVWDLADALRAPVGRALDESLHQALNDDWLVPAHLLLLDLTGTEDRPSLENVRNGLDALLRHSRIQSLQAQGAPTSLEQSNREVALDAAVHLLAKWHAFVKERVTGKDAAAVILLDEKLAPDGVRTWRDLLGPARLARWGLKPEDLDPVFARFASLLERRLTDDPRPIGGGLHLGGVGLIEKKTLVLTADLAKFKSWRTSMESRQGEDPRAGAKPAVVYVTRRVLASPTKTERSASRYKGSLKMQIEKAVQVSVASPGAETQLDALLNRQHQEALAAQQFSPSSY
jgi:hypothetical protein